MPTPAITSIVTNYQKQFRIGPSGWNTASASAGVITITCAGVKPNSQLIIPIVLYNATATISSVTCSGESDPSADDVLYRAGSGILSDAAIQFYTLANVTTGGTKTITITLSASVTAVGGCVEVINGDSNAFTDGVATAAAGSVNITTNNDKELVAVIGVSAGAQSPIPPYSQYLLPNPLQRNSMYLQLNTGIAGTKSASFSGSGNNIIMAAAFKLS